mmetsp:Transcript_125705/g.361387  ORF Transcript_125705/g.361387 Transcript_125705/m.361387 type:complete len:364 (-) Transcript_125705:1377-2468(-)
MRSSFLALAVPNVTHPRLGPVPDSSAKCRHCPPSYESNDSWRTTAPWPRCAGTFGESQHGSFCTLTPPLGRTTQRGTSGAFEALLGVSSARCSASSSGSCFKAFIWVRSAHRAVVSNSSSKLLVMKPANLLLAGSNQQPAFSMSFIAVPCGSEPSMASQAVRNVMTSCWWRMMATKSDAFRAEARSSSRSANTVLQCSFKSSINASIWTLVSFINRSPMRSLARSNNRNAQTRPTPGFSLFSATVVSICLAMTAQISHNERFFNGSSDSSNGFKNRSMSSKSSLSMRSRKSLSTRAVRMVNMNFTWSMLRLACEWMCSSKRDASSIACSCVLASLQSMASTRPSLMARSLSQTSFSKCLHHAA